MSCWTVDEHLKWISKKCRAGFSVPHEQSLENRKRHSTICNRNVNLSFAFVFHKWENAFCVSQENEKQTNKKCFNTKLESNVYTLCLVEYESFHPLRSIGTWKHNQYERLLPSKLLCKQISTRKVPCSVKQKTWKPMKDVNIRMGDSSTY